MTSFGAQDALGPLAGSLPQGAFVLVCWLATVAGSRVAEYSFRKCRAFLLLASWAVAMAASVMGCVAFQAFARGAPGPVSASDVADFVARHGVTLAALLMLGIVAATCIQLASVGRDPVKPAGLAGSGRSQAETIGAIGETLVAYELRELGWAYLTNVVLSDRGRSVEIDHLVRAPDGIIVIETKTLSGVVSGDPDAEFWVQSSRSGTRKFMNPLAQNARHMSALRMLIPDPRVSFRGLVVSAGHARFVPATAGCVVPLENLTTVLHASVAPPGVGQRAIDSAWAVLVREAAKSDRRSRAHIAYVRAKRRNRPGWF
jgi:hypothetical protein